VQGVIDLSLRLLGKFDVTSVTDFAGATDAIERRRPDLILLDRMLPDKDGLDVCRHFKNDASTKEIPIVFLSARSDPADIRAGMDAGASGYITKPFDPVALADRIRAIFGDTTNK
jgi:DNA-binding response OmpR family regulator